MTVKRRMLRQDRVLLEELESKYGKDSIANAIMLIANGTDGAESSISQKEAVLDYIMYLEGLRIRLREIHWSTDNKSTHLLTDEMIENIESHEDTIAENLMGLIDGFKIKVGCIAPKITALVDLQEILREFSNVVIQLCASLENSNEYTGIVNELDDMMHQIGKWQYLERLK